MVIPFSSEAEVVCLARHNKNTVTNQNETPLPSVTDIPERWLIFLLIYLTDYFLY